MQRFPGKRVLCVSILGMFQILNATKLYETKVLDKNYLMFHFRDGIVEFVDDGLGSTAYSNGEDASNSKAVSYGTALNITKATDVSNWRIKSPDDPHYGETGAIPTAISRKKIVNGMSMGPWGSSDWIFDYTYEHFIYLQLPVPMETGKTYTIEINENLNSDIASQSITYDIFNCPSEAVHTNLVGYLSSSQIKAADLYHFMGDGGNRDYSEFVGNDVYIYKVDTQESWPVGTVTFWMKNKQETFYNLTGSDVWNVDFSGFSAPGTYRLAVEGVGCSEDFQIKEDIYHDPFKISILGYFYMRIGQDNMDMTPVPRRPLYIQGQDPNNCVIYITDMDPYHPGWGALTSGDKWDTPAKWAAYKKAGNPTNPRAIGGHSDACDWDRHLGHVVNIYDLCLAYILSDGALDDDDLRIAESGNGIPDILDEARNEVDFWLNLRYGKGYSHGLTIPDDNNQLYQADNTPPAAWANSLNSAMLAYCFQIAGLRELRNTYRDSAVIAYDYANNLADPMLNTLMEDIRGTDFKMMTAAYLYNLTGDTVYEDVVKSLSVVNSPNSTIYVSGSHNQLWGTAAYLLSKRTIHYPELQANMQASIIAEAKSKETNRMQTRPSRRGYSDEQAWWQTNEDMHRTIIAHAVCEKGADQIAFLNALQTEADWGLGRNPLNMIQMTTATTELAAKRSVENCYTTGADDGTPGLHPGHTPYLNTSGWGGSMVGSNPEKVLQKYYPDISQWPQASKYINTRFIWAHSEFTPRQTMRGKTLLYAYLYSLSQTGGSAVQQLIADAGPNQKITDADGSGKETVQLNASGSYSTSGQITSYQWLLNHDEIAVGKMATVELNTGDYEIILKIEDDAGASDSDTVMIDIVPPASTRKADYDFETAAQFDEWVAENFNTSSGGDPAAFLSTETVHGGSYSYQIQGNFTANSNIALRQNNPLDDAVIAITYYVWVPQAMVDSAAAVSARDASLEGGLQNFLMHDGWQWESQWYAIQDLQGNAWNMVSLNIPENIEPANVESFGICFTNNGVDAGEMSVYVDDIYFDKNDQTGLNDLTPAVIPKEYQLFHNYPNPFNPQTRIKYQLPNQSKVQIGIYDLMGHEVRSLLNETQHAGSYEMIFDGSNLSSGIYFTVFHAGGYKDVKKMLLLK